MCWERSCLSHSRMTFAARSAFDSCIGISNFSCESIWFLCSSRSAQVWNSAYECLGEASCSPWTAYSAWNFRKDHCSFRIFLCEVFSCTPLMSLLDFRFVWLYRHKFTLAWNVWWAWHRTFPVKWWILAEVASLFCKSSEASRCFVSHPLPKTWMQTWRPHRNCILSKNLSSLLVNRGNICTADLNDGVGLITCERTLYGERTTQSCCPWIRWYLCCHREMVQGEMECVEVLGKVERSVENRAQTLRSANERWCARMINNSFEGHMICFTLSLELSLEPHARKSCVCSAVYCLQRCGAVHFLHLPPFACESFQQAIS